MYLYTSSVFSVLTLPVVSYNQTVYWSCKREGSHMSRVVRKPDFGICENKDADQLRGVFATQIVQSLYFLNTKFQASSNLMWLHSPVCVEPGWKPRRPVFSQRGSYCKSATKLIRAERWPALMKSFILFCHIFQLLFGTDGYLYIFVGDGGPAQVYGSDAQNT